MSKRTSCLFFFLLSVVVSAQDLNFQSLLLSDKLKENANAVIRKEHLEVEIASINKMIIRRERIVTVLNEYGRGTARTWEIYDEVSKIKKQEAVYYDQLGNQIRKVKKKDFVDSSYPGANLITDNRLSHYEFTPRGYPYTVVYTSEVETASTIFVNPWNPVPGFYVSVEKSSYHLKNTSGIAIRFEENNLDSLQVVKNNKQQELEYTLTDLPAFKREILSPDFEEFAPKVKVALAEFSLVGVPGTAINWKDFGKWQYENLLKGKSDLPSETIAKISELTAGIDNDLEKARLIYEYVQENTRYISVQLGIGGWEPMSASHVDKLGYGDCKALTNYTRALLASQNITSYYSVVYGGEDRVDLDADFASMQGNHVILNLPTEGEDVWLECTSQTAPFNYLGDFTDNRNVLVVRPEGGEIVRTKAYGAPENLQESTAKIVILPEGNFTAEFSRSSYGVPYGNIYPLMRQSEKDQQLFYKNSWGHLRKLELQKISHNNDRKTPVFQEELELSGDRYASKAGKRLLLPLHFLEVPVYSLPGSGARNFPLEISRGRSYNDSYIFVLPPGFEAESLPEDVELESEFGLFTAKVQLVQTEAETRIHLDRQFVLNQGTWPASSYGLYRDFMNQISALLKQKAVIVKPS